MPTILRYLSNRVVNPLVVAVFLGTALVSVHAHAQDKSADATDIQVLRDALKTDKRTYIASMLSLTSAEAKRFWPIYDSYQRVIDDTSQRRVVAFTMRFDHQPRSADGAVARRVQRLVHAY